MTIGEYIKLTDIETYEKLIKLCKNKPKKKIELGDSIENLMKSNSYRRVGRRIRQIKWG
jgi:hypothetical protein